MDDISEVPPFKRRKLNHSENLICPITLELFKDPVIIEDGNTYEKEAILKYLNNNNVSPITREPVNKQIVIPNRAIKSTVEAIHDENIFDIPNNKTVETRDIFYDETNKLICFKDTKEPVLSSQLLKVIFKHGNQYCGSVRDGKTEGHGVFTWANGDQYDGEHKNGEKEGHGVLTLANGDNYDGEWKNGRREGHGVMEYINGSTYNGKWKNDSQDTRDD